MTKRIKPVMGIPVEKFLSEMWIDPYPEDAKKKSFDANTVELKMSLIGEVLVSINSDVCATLDQAEYIRENIDFAIENETDKPELLILSTLINSFRLDCANCLNGECKMRDPEKPVPEAPKEDGEK